MANKPGFEMGSYSLNPEGELKILENLQEVEHMLTNEITTATEFSDLLNIELKEIEDFVKEIEKYKAQIIQIERLAEHKKKLSHAIKEKFAVEPTERDLDKIHELFIMLNKITPEYSEMTKEFLNSIERMHLSSLGKLYADSDKNKKIIREIDSFSRKMHARVKDLYLENSTLDAELNSIGALAANQQQERLERKKPKKKYGF